MKPIPVSPRLTSLAESLTMAVDVKIKERVARGEDIINLGVGQPDFPTPAFILEETRKQVEAGATRYTPPGGTPELRKAAAAYLQETGVPAEAKTTLISCGAKHALYNAMAAVLQPGDEVLIPVPFWVTYPEQVRLVDAVPVPVVPGAGLKVTPDDLEQKRTSRTRMVLLNSPSNPSGAVYDRDEVEAIATWCNQHDLLILSDEIYDRLVFDGVKTTSPASLGDDIAQRTLTVNGVSKTFAMTGWRIGFLNAAPEVIDAIVKFQGQTTGNPSSASQAAAHAALSGPREPVEEMRAAYEHRRNLAVEALCSIPGVELDPPRGAFYVYPRLTEAVSRAGGSVALAGKLVESGVGVVPGAGFGQDDHLRLSYAVSDNELIEGLKRFRSGLEALTQG